jgi:cellulose synthase/poly-beta-1,6-N-acetylglucosamine synthase-like glycosyltransferase
MINAITIIILFSGLIYFSLILSLTRGWSRIKQFDPDKNCKPDEIFTSIIIAARNEEENISFCLRDLIGQDFPKSGFEVIIVDDHSEDATVSEVKKIQANYPNVKLLSLSAMQLAEGGKKAAVAEGVRRTKGELIITTDADCRFEKHWLSTFVAYYQQHQPVMISGPVVFSPQSRFAGKFMELEFISLVVSGAGALGLKKPLMCNGANLAFRRDVFLELNAFDSNKNWASGDDMFLMHSIRKKYGSHSIHFLKSRDAIVKTQAPTGLKEFLMQRIRWGSKTRAYPDTFTALVAAVVFLNALMLLVSTISLLLTPVMLYPVMAGWFLKISIDLLLLYQGCSFFRRIRLLNWFIPFQLMHVFYITASASLAGVSGYVWKGRRH